MAEVIRRYTYQGKEVGRLVSCNGQTNFETELNEQDVITLLREMPPGDKIHMKRLASAVCKLIEFYGIDPRTYVENEEIMIYVADRGFRNMSELYRGDRNAWLFVKQRSLEGELFKDFRPKNHKNLFKNASAEQKTIFVRMAGFLFFEK